MTYAFSFRVRNTCAGLFRARNTWGSAMAKRKRLTLSPGLVTGDPGDPLPASDALFPLGTRRAMSAPIARVAGEASAAAALTDLATEVAAARDAGRMIQSVPLAAVDEAYLVRDRMVTDEAELEVLIQSLRARGQQVPVEAVALQDGRYGLISGWRRLTALRRLAAEDARFGTVLVLLRRPETASDAYLAMVEENEIRVGLSYYERARIVARAAEHGVFPDESAALSHLFAAASRAKRSKIGSFLRIVTSLDDRLRYASAIPERLGLTLSRALDTDHAFALRLRDRLRKTPVQTAAAELALLERAIAQQSAARLPAAKPPAANPADTNPAGPPAPAEPVVSTQWPPQPLPGTQEIPGIWVESGFGVITLRGPKVTAYFQSQLTNWLSGMRED